MVDDSPGALFRKGAGEFLEDELQSLYDLAESGDDNADKIMRWVVEPADGRELLLTFPEAAPDVIEMLGEVARTAENFVLARAAAFLLEHGKPPTHLRYQLVCEFEDLN